MPFRPAGRPAARAESFREDVEDAARDPWIIGLKRAPELTLAAAVIEKDRPQLQSGYKAGSA